jgi:hypothetical protein
MPNKKMMHKKLSSKRPALGRGSYGLLPPQSLHKAKPVGQEAEPASYKST